MCVFSTQLRPAWFRLIAERRGAQLVWAGGDVLFGVCLHLAQQGLLGVTAVS